MPGRSCENVKRPSAPVAVSRFSRVAAFSSLMVTFGISAPAGSVTTPVRLAVKVWPEQGRLPIRIEMARQRPEMQRSIRPPFVRILSSSADFAQHLHGFGDCDHHSQWIDPRSKKPETFIETSPPPSIPLHHHLPNTAN